MAIPVIDLFAGPGGLGEGFASITDSGKRSFDIRLSVEKDAIAHQTLELRSFFRQFATDRVPADYFRLIRGEIDRDELFTRYPLQAEKARREAWCAELGSAQLSKVELDSRISAAIRGHPSWVLIGGPPCQAYSVAGRSRNQRIKGYSAEEDSRHFLYREYLRVLATHWPAVFVMENVTGILSSKVAGRSIFPQILEDLQDPKRAWAAGHGKCPGYDGYRIYSLVKKSEGFDIFGSPMHNGSAYVIESEKYGVPQARHRVILLGVRQDIPHDPKVLTAARSPVSADKVLEGLPRLRSGLSQQEDTAAEWRAAIQGILKEPWLNEVRKIAGSKVLDLLLKTARDIKMPRRNRGGEFVQCNPTIAYRKDWYLDHRIGGVCNSTTRSHILEDLYRYLYAACFTRVEKRSPRLSEFPKALHPDHKNIGHSLGHGNFADRFRVQRPGEPSTTVMSHIAKDGHYYIHYDPTQCRSLTVREAARLQTFPDNYFFCGNRTEQYAQVGNAVPPLLARQIGEVVRSLLECSSSNDTNGQAFERAPQLEHVEDSA